MKLKIQKRVSVLIIAIGFAVLLYGVIVEDEPTLVALLLLTGGALWHFITRARIRKRHRQSSETE